MATKSKPVKKITPRAKKLSTAIKPVPSTGRRQLKPPQQKLRFLPFKKRPKPPKVPRKPLPSSFRIFQNSLLILKNHWRLFLSLSVVYGLLNLIFVKGFATAVDLSTLKSDISGVFHGHSAGFGTGLASFLTLFGGTSGSTSSTAGAYQAFLVLIVSLAVIWTLRQVYSGQNPLMKDGFYKGIYPMVPVLIILALVVVQLIPFAIGTAGFSTIVAGGIAINVFEGIITGLICLGFVWISLWWLSSSLIALYIATLPDMSPMTALRSARDLVIYRRTAVCLRLLFLPVALLIIALIIMVPIILFITGLATWAFFLLATIGLIVIHSYVYTLYRDLL